MNPAQHLLISLIRGYRWTLSPLLATAFGPLAGCRFHPTCSVYALEAIRLHGAGRGSWLALRRLARCHPWGACGDDPVPKPEPAGAVSPSPTPLLNGGLNPSGSHH